MAAVVVLLESLAKDSVGNCFARLTIVSIDRMVESELQIFKQVVCLQPFKADRRKQACVCVRV